MEWMTLHSVDELLPFVTTVIQLLLGFCQFFTAPSCSFLPPSLLEWAWVFTSDFTKLLQPPDETRLLQSVQRAHFCLQLPSLSWTSAISCSKEVKMSASFLRWGRWLLCFLMLNFNPQQCTVLDGAGCIINDVQIPHMRGCIVGLMKDSVSSDSLFLSLSLSLG